MTTKLRNSSFTATDAGRHNVADASGPGAQNLLEVAMKKALLVLMAFVLISGLAFASGDDEASASEVRELTIWEGLWANAAVSVTNLAETPLYTEAMKRTGIEVTWLHPPQGQDDENFNLMIASNELPDLIYRDWNRYPGGPEKALSDGVIIELNDIIENQMPNLWSVYTQNPDWLKAAKTDSGTLYDFPFFRGHEDLMVFFGPQMRKDWLDEMGMETPETLAEWDKLLVAFKEAGYVEYPLTFTNFRRGRGINAAGGIFIQAFGTTWDFHQTDSGKVRFGPNTNEFKEFLIFFKDWYDRGLVDPEFFSNERKTFDAKVVNGDAAAWNSYTGSGIGAYIDSHRGDDSGYDLIAAKYPVINKGDTPFFGQRDTNVRPTGTGITTQARNIDLAAEWSDYPYGEEGHILFNFGIEGENFEWVYDYPGWEGKKFGKYNDLMMNNPEGKTLSQMGGLYTRAFYAGPIIQERQYIWQYAHRKQQQDAIMLWAQTDAAKHMIPPTTPTPAEAEDKATIMSEINTYRDEMVVKFITGQEPIENFGAFQARLKQMGIERAIEIEQAALNRFNSR
jgi:putative aldouronate transport system substrate-binding protein